MPLHLEPVELNAPHPRHRSVLEAIGDTPLIEPTGFLPRGPVQVFLKLEASNPGGSAKDRPAATLIEAAVRSGRLRRGSVVIESSSGNMGIGLAQACVWYGLRFVCVVDVRAQPGTLAAIRALGAEIDTVTVPEGHDQNPLAARLLRTDALLVGGSAWGVLQAVRTCHRRLPPGQYVAIGADSGHRYLDTVFDDDWVEEALGCPPGRLARLVGQISVNRL